MLHRNMSVCTIHPSTTFLYGYINMFKNLPTADFSAFGAPVQKLIELNTATMTKAFELQQAAAKKQIADAQANFKAISEIKDVEALTSFVTEQSEVAKANLETLKSEAQVSVESTKAYFAEVQAILTEGKDAVVKAATK
ncbi:MAG: phasin family protein [Motiliproteus sp.]